MALSGTISGSYRGYTLQTQWTARQNISGNYSDITATHKLVCASTYSLYISARSNTCKIDGTTKTFASPAISTAGNQTITLGTTSQRVYHNADGTKSFAIQTIFNMQAEIAGVWVSNITASGNVVLDTIPRNAQITSASDFTDEQNPSFNYSNAGGFTMSASLTFAGQSISRSIGNATSGTYTFNLTETERNKLLNATPNSKTLSVTFLLQTTISGVIYNYTTTRTMTVINATPTAPTLAYQDSNSTTVAITGDNQRIIQNKSILQATIGTGTAKKGASIVSYSTTINGVTVAGNGVKTIGTIDTAQNAKLITTITDSRGFTNTAEVQVIIDAWQDPTAIVTAYRVNNFETSTRLLVDSNYSYLNGQNTITCEYCYKKASDANYNSWTTIANNTQATIQLDNLYEWNIKVRIKDALSGYIEYVKQIGKGIPILFIDTDKQSVGVNCFPTGTGTLEVGGASVVESGSNANGSYTKFYDGTMICTKKVSFNHTFTEPWGSMFTTSLIDLGDYPAPFSEVPTVNASIMSNYSCFIQRIGDYSATKVGTTYLSRPVNTNALGYIAIIAVGKWK